jgi:hypothetical protein
MLSTQGVQSEKYRLFQSWNFIGRPSVQVAELAASPLLSNLIHSLDTLMVSSLLAHGQGKYYFLEPNASVCTTSLADVTA